MWQLFMIAGVAWVAGALVTHVGWWLADKTVMVPAGAVLIAIGAALQFLSFLALVAP